jgi:hypothetical protein
MRARVKAARAIASTTTGLAEVLKRDWSKAERFYAKFDIDETLFRRGVPAQGTGFDEDFTDLVRRRAMHEARHVRRIFSLRLAERSDRQGSVEGRVDYHGRRRSDHHMDRQGV